MLLRRWFVAVYYCSTYYEHMYGFVCVLHLRARSVCDRTPAKCNGCHHINEKCISLIALAVLDTAQQRSMLGVLGVWFPQSFAVSSSSMHVRSVPIGSVLSFITNITFAYTTTTYLCYVWCVCVYNMRCGHVVGYPQTSLADQARIAAIVNNTLALDTNAEWHCSLYLSQFQR